MKRKSSDRKSHPDENAGTSSSMSRGIRRFLNYLPEITVGFISISVFFILLFRFLPPPATYLMVKRWIQSEKSGLAYDWVPISEMHVSLPVCAMASEDQNLPFHYGLDLDAISSALEHNKKGRKVRGASTISQQVAKNLFLWPERNYLRKALELYFTLGIETFWKKERIAEMYLNIAEMGDLIFGVQAAAKTYYGKNASDLKPQESAAIIAILPNPLKYSVKNPSTYVSGRRDKIVRLYNTLDGPYYIRELYVRSDSSMYDFTKYKDE